MLWFLTDSFPPTLRWGATRPMILPLLKSGCEREHLKVIWEGFRWTVPGVIGRSKEERVEKKRSKREEKGEIGVGVVRGSSFVVVGAGRALNYVRCGMAFVCERFLNNNMFK